MIEKEKWLLRSGGHWLPIFFTSVEYKFYELIKSSGKKRSGGEEEQYWFGRARMHVQELRSSAAVLRPSRRAGARRKSCRRPCVPRGHALEAAACPIMRPAGHRARLASVPRCSPPQDRSAGGPAPPGSLSSCQSVASSMPACMGLSPTCDLQLQTDKPRRPRSRNGSRPGRAYPCPPRQF